MEALYNKMNNTSLSKAGVAPAGTLGTLFDMSGMFLISPVLVAKPSTGVAPEKICSRHISGAL